MNVDSTFQTTANMAPENRSARSESQMHMDDFFKILTTQLTTQDPLKPIEDKDFISQMATFSNLQQMETLSTSFSDFRSEQQFLSSQNLIGKVVRVETPEGEIVEGTVSRVERKDGRMVPFVGEMQTEFSWITAIREPDAPAE